MTRTLKETVFSGSDTPKVVIVGCGMGGIAAGVKLVKAGIRSFTIFEASEGIGGTWWDNRYPGAECDVPSYLYSYGFRSNNWTRTHARQPEIQAYLEDVVREYDLRKHIQFSTPVLEATWNERTHTYLVSTGLGEKSECHVLISAVGLLNQPHIPDWPGLTQFTGPTFHSSQWEHDHDLSGKRVAVVGTGSTAVQIVAELAPVVETLLVFQREPGWILPKDARDYTTEERQKLARWSRRVLARTTLIYRNEKGLWRGTVFHPGSALSEAGERRARQFIESELSDRPELASAVTPSYPYPGKRPVFHSSFYATLRRDNVKLIPRAVTALTATEIVDSSGCRHPIDLLVLATGFHAARYLPKLCVRGVSGATLQETWAGDPAAFLGLTVPGFPNFFMLYGPNTNGGEIIFVLERGAEYAVRAIKKLIRRRSTAIDVKRSWYLRYNRWLQSKLEGTSWTMSRNYFTSESGRVVTQWPFGALFYGLLTKALGPFSERTRSIEGAGPRKRSAPGNMKHRLRPMPDASND